MRAVGGLQLYFPWWNFVRALEKVTDGSVTLIVQKILRLYDLFSL